jgi:hypothetical protein
VPFNGAHLRTDTLLFATACSLLSKVQYFSYGRVTHRRVHVAAREGSV